MLILISLPKINRRSRFQKV